MTEPNSETIQPDQGQSVPGVHPHTEADQPSGQPQVDPSLSSSVQPPPRHEKPSKDCRPDQTPVLKYVLEILVAGIVAAYTFAAFQQLAVMRQQLNEMIDAQRPWVGVSGDLVMTRPPRFWVNPVRTTIQTEIYSTWSIQNFGNSPSRKVNHTLVLSSTAPTETQKIACAIGDQIHENPSAFVQVLFPGNKIQFPETNQVTAIRADEITDIWLVGCITYEDGAGTVHHTKLIWISDTDNSKSAVALSSPHLNWTPFTKFRLVKSEAD